MKNISLCLWFDTQAEEAAQLYTSLFERSKITGGAKYGDAGSEISGQRKGSTMTAIFEIEGLRIIALNGGPLFKFTPAISLFVGCDSETEIDRLWGALMDSGSALMELQKYPFAKKFGWCQDRFGLSWQLILAKREQKITPALLFTKAVSRKAEEAMKYYTSLFPDSKIIDVYRDDKTKAVLHSVFQLQGQAINAMESDADHAFTFNEAVSFVVNCRTQEEIDKYWAKLCDGGSPSRCGWLKDKFGVSWQIVPTLFEELMQKASPKKAESVMKALFAMNKIDIAGLKQAYEKE